MPSACHGWGLHELVRSPEYEAVDIDKAVRWAIMSAAEEAPLTAFILPEWPRTALFKT